MYGRGLEGWLSQRRKLLQYLRRTSFDSYAVLIARLGLKDSFAKQVCGLDGAALHAVGTSSLLTLGLCRIDTAYSPSDSRTSPDLHVMALLARLVTARVPYVLPAAQRQLADSRRQICKGSCRAQGGPEPASWLCGGGSNKPAASGAVPEPFQRNAKTAFWRSQQRPSTLPAMCFPA